MKAKTRLASKAKSRAVALAAQYEKKARAAQADIERALTQEAREDAQDAARIYWSMAADWHATATRAEEISPARFTAPNKGAQSKTAARLEFVRGVAADNAGIKRQALALAIWDHPDAGQHFKTYEAVYRFLGRPDFF